MMMMVESSTGFSDSMEIHWFAVRVRKRPPVLSGSDGVVGAVLGCTLRSAAGKHSCFSEWTSFSVVKWLTFIPVELCHHLWGFTRNAALHPPTLPIIPKSRNVLLWMQGGYISPCTPWLALLSWNIHPEGPDRRGQRHLLCSHEYGDLCISLVPVPGHQASSEPGAHGARVTQEIWEHRRSE